MLEIRKNRVEDIQDWLISQLAQQLGLAPDNLDIREPFARFGLDSIESVTLAADLGDWLGRPISSTILWDYPSIESLAEHLAEQ